MLGDSDNGRNSSYSTPRIVQFGTRGSPARLRRLHAPEGHPAKCGAAGVPYYRPLSTEPCSTPFGELAPHLSYLVSGELM